MNVSLLIDAVMRQTVVLIAQLATAGGVRTPLADVAGQVFRELAEELHRQGVSRKVAADMFGMALRTYRRKIQRLTESQTETGRSLWEAIYGFVAGQSFVSRRAVLARFHRDDEPTLRAVLQDLVDSGLLYRSGRGAEASYRAVPKDEIAAPDAAVASEGLEALVWGAIYRGATDRAELLRALPLAEVTLGPVLDRLVDSGRVRRVEEAGRERFETDGFVVPLGAPVGWESAVFDHFQAVVGTIASRLRADRITTSDADRIGGSTYSMEIWPGHPLEEEVQGELARLRAHLSELRERVAAHNRDATAPGRRTRVVIYGGQNLIEVEH